MRGLLLLLLAPIASAADDPTELGTIVVTPARVEQSSFETPAAVGSVSAEQIHDNRAGVNLSEMLAAMPGVLARDRQNYAQDQQISIRGFGTRAPFGIVGTRLYVDGIPATMPDGQGQVSHFNLDSAGRIEVLRGPFSTLYGNAAGGVIQIFTAPGEPGIQPGLEIVAGSYGTVRASANVRGANDFLNYNLDFTHFQTDGTRGHAAARRESANGRWSFDLREGRRLTLLLNSVQIPDAQDPLGLTRAQFETAPRAASPTATQFNTRKSVRQTQGGLVYDQPLWGGESLRLMGYYGARAVEQYLSLPIAAQANPLSSGGVVDLGNDYAGADLRWTSRGSALGRPLTLIAGIEYDVQDSQRRGYENFQGTELGVKGALRRDEDNRTYDFNQYLQVQWDFAPDWSALAGVRRNRVEFRSDDHYVTEANPDDSDSFAFADVTPAAGVLYRAHESLRLYVSYGEGFDSPTFAELAYRPDGQSGFNRDLAPANTRTGEIGAKWALGQTTYANAALFGALTRDEIVVANAQGGRTTYQNVDVRRTGAEFELVTRLSSRWRAQLAYTWLDARFSESFLTCASANCPTADTPVQKDNRVPGVPASNAFAALRWGAEAGWNAAVEGTFLSAVATSSSNASTAPAYALLGANAGYVWMFPSWRLRAFARVDNLLNRNYAGSVIVNDTNGRFYEPGPARSAFAGLELRLRY